MERVPFKRIPLDPRRTNNFLDSCAFNPKLPDEYAASREIERLYDDEKIVLLITHSVEKEIEHPNTPADVKKKALEMARTFDTHLTPDEINRQEAIRVVFTGSGNPETYRADAQHLFLAGKYGGHFITVDGRIIKRRNVLMKICAVDIFTPSEWLEHYHQNVVEDELSL